MEYNMKLADYVAEFLSNHVDHIFVGNGGCVITQLDSISRCNNIKDIPCQNEQGAAIAAEAYARLHGFGVALATSGPGVTNLIQGIACAWYDSIPVLYISGAPPTNHLKHSSKVRQKGFQEMDVVAMVKPITKYAVLLTDPNDIRYQLEKLVWMSQNDGKGPVLLDLPDDLQRAEVDPKTMRRYAPTIKEYGGPFTREENIKDMVARIEDAHRPVVIVGGGVKIGDAEKQMKSWLNYSKLPFVTTWSTIDMFPENEWDNLIGNFGIASNRYGNFAVQNADLIVSFGSRLDTHQTGSDPEAFAPDAYKICINIDHHEFYKNNMIVNLTVHDDVKNILKQLNIIHMDKQNIDEWKIRVGDWKRKYPVCEPDYYKQKGSVNPYVFMNELSKITKDGDIVITDAGATLTWTMQAYKMRHKQELFSAFNHSPMGYALPASIGAQFARHGEQIICITGDGGLNMNIQELETVVHNNLPIKIFVMNNGEYGIIKQTQDTWMDGRYTAVDPNSGVGFPDIVKVANAYGLPVVTIEDNEFIDRSIWEVLQLDSFVLCNVIIKSGEQILPKLVFGRPIQDMAPLIPRLEYEENMNNG
jgi:acetolactate synthase-1/2/3 large subunit